MSEPVRVIVGACRCPGTPHGDDWVELAPRLGVVAGAAAMAAIKAAEATESEMEAAIAASFLRHGITAWSFTGELDKHGYRPTLAITNDTIASNLDWATSAELAEKANELYAEDLFRPLARRLAPSLEHGLTGESTSVTTDSGVKAPKPSRPSSQPATAGTPSEVLVP